MKPVSTKPDIRAELDLLLQSGKSGQVFRDRAATLWKMHIPIIPLQPKSKEPCTPHAAHDATVDPQIIAGWVQTYAPASNVGCVAGYNGFWFLDDDKGTLAETYKRETGQDLPHTFKVKTSRGYHYYFLHDDASRLIRYGSAENSGVIDIPGYKGEARCNSQYVVGPGSIHPSGAVYEIVDSTPPVAAPVQLLEWLQNAYALSEALKAESKGKKTRKSVEESDSAFKKLFQSIGYHPLQRRIDALEDARLHLTSDLKAGATVPCPMPGHTHSDFTPCFGPVANAPELLHCLGNCGWSGDVIAACFELDGGAKKYKSMYDCARAVCEEEGLNYEEFFPKANTAYGAPPAELPEEEPSDPTYDEVTRPLHPKLSDDALYGLAGDIVKTIMPQTESHPAGLLVQILMYFGNVIGRSAYFQVESTRHYGNLFAVRVGISSRARKGTGGDRIDALFEQVDPVWYKTRLRSGLSSSEGLIVAVGDEELGEDRDGRPVGLHGEVHDKRLVSYEGEFSQVLVVMQRAGNTISTNLRNAWDGKPLRTMTIKPRLATNHTISILGDITGTELRSRMSSNDSMNGFANRFLWVHVERTKRLPFGGEEIDFGSYIEDLKKAVEFAQGQERIFMDENARKMWGRAYEQRFEDCGGLFGAVISRGEAQVLRLSLSYAMLDCSDHIRSEHLRAALALWQYCEDSARFVFDELTSEQEMIIEFLREHGGQTKTDFLKVLFGRHRPAAEIAADLEVLVHRGIVTTRKNKKGVATYFIQGRKKCPVLPEDERA